MTSLLDVLKSAQFVTDSQGQQVAIQIRPAVWKAMVAWLEATDGGPELEEITHIPAISYESDTSLIQAAAKLSEPAFAAIWNNPEDDIYNDL